ncbi:hypothetical protein FRC00_013500, partial [Tulasnella sp. 408]
MPALTLGSWSNIQLPSLPWRRQRSASKSTTAPSSTLDASAIHQHETDSPTIVAPVPRRLLQLPNLSLPTVFDHGYFGIARSLDNLLPPTPDSTKSVSSADDGDFDDFRSLPDTPESPKEGEGHAKITIRTSEGGQLSITSSTSSTPSTRTDTTATTTSSNTTMPYVTPTSPVGTISSAPFSIIQHSFSPSSIHSATPITPSLPSPPAALMFNYESNTSLDALPSVPRRKSNFRPKMVTPQASYSRGAPSEPASAGLDKLFHAVPAPPPPAGTSGTITVQPPTPDKRVQDEQASLANAKRVRGARTTNFTTVVAASDSQSQSEDEDDDVPEPQQHPQRRGCVASPMGEGGVNMSAMGRKRGEMMRHAVSMDASSYTSSTSSTSVSPALAHAATAAPMMMVTNATPLSSAVTSPVSPYPPMDSAASRPLAARKFHHAIVAGQGNVLRLNMDAIKRARSASPTAPAPASASAVAPSGAGTSSSLFLAPASAVSAYDGRPKFNTVGPLSAQFVRKKSGELVKPALRTSRTYCPGDASPLESTPSSSQMLMYRRNSAPTTPTPKN